MINRKVADMRRPSCFIRLKKQSNKKVKKMIAVAAVAADDDNDIEDKLILSNHGDILLNKSNSSMFLYVQIY